MAAELLNSTLMGHSPFAEATALSAPNPSFVGRAFRLGSNYRSLTHGTPIVLLIGDYGMNNVNHARCTNLPIRRRHDRIGNVTLDIVGATCSKSTPDRPAR
jgi:hypothetical protein